MEHREIRKLLETEIMDGPERVELLAVEQELNDYFKSQPSEIFRNQLKSHLLEEARKYSSSNRTGRFWLYPAVAMVAVAALVVIAFIKPTFMENLPKVVPEQQLVDKIADTQLVALQEINENSVVNEPENIENNENIKNEIVNESKVGGILARVKARVADSKSFLVADNSGTLDLEGKGDLGSTETPVNITRGNTEGALGIMSDPGSQAEKQLTSSRFSDPSRNFQITTSSFPKSGQVKAFQDRGRLLNAGDLQKLAAIFGINQAMVLSSDGAEYRYFGNSKTLTLFNGQVPTTVYYTNQSTRKAANQVNQAEALIQARKLLSALECFNPGLYTLKNTVVSSENYQFIFYLQVDNHPLTGPEIRVKVNRQSGEVDEFYGTMHNFEVLGEYPLITVEQAINKLLQNASSAINNSIGSDASKIPIKPAEKIVVEKIVLIQDYQLNHNREAITIPKYQLSGKLADGSSFEAQVEAIE